MCNGSVSDSFAVGTVTGESLVGGLVGANNNGIVSDCYAAGEVGGAGSTGIGGLVGWNGGEIYSSYYDTDTTGQEDTGKGEPRTTEEMQLRSTLRTGTLSMYGALRMEKTIPSSAGRKGAPVGLYCGGREQLGKTWWKNPAGHYRRHGCRRPTARGFLPGDDLQRC